MDGVTGTGTGLEGWGLDGRVAEAVPLGGGPAGSPWAPAGTAAAPPVEAPAVGADEAPLADAAPSRA